MRQKLPTKNHTIHIFKNLNLPGVFSNFIVKTKPLKDIVIDDSSELSQVPTLKDKNISNFEVYVVTFIDKSKELPNVIR